MQCEVHQILFSTEGTSKVFVKYFVMIVTTTTGIANFIQCVYLLSKRSRTNFENILLSTAIADTIICTFVAIHLLQKLATNNYFGLVLDFSLYSPASHVILISVDRLMEARKTTNHMIFHANRTYSCLIIISAWGLPILMLFLTVIIKTFWICKIFSYLLVPLYAIMLVAAPLIKKRTLLSSTIRPYIESIGPICKRIQRRCLFVTLAVFAVFVICTLPTFLCSFKILCLVQASAALLLSGSALRPLICCIIYRITSGSVTLNCRYRASSGLTDTSVNLTTSTSR